MKYKIFVSGAQKELKKERRAVKEFIRKDALLSEYFDVFLFERSFFAKLTSSGQGNYF